MGLLEAPSPLKRSDSRPGVDAVRWCRRMGRGLVSMAKASTGGLSETSCISLRYCRTEEVGEESGPARCLGAREFARLTSMRREKGTQDATAQQIPTREIKALACQTLVTKKVAIL